jgi:hypothetical protein
VEGGVSPAPFTRQIWFDSEGVVVPFMERLSVFGKYSDGCLDEKNKSEPAR